jgi:hypothetical protein
MTPRPSLPRVSIARLPFSVQAARVVLRGVLGVLLPVCFLLGSFLLHTRNAWAAAPVRGTALASSAPSGSPAADDSAPMCDVHAASVAARAEVPEVDQGKLEPLPCDALFQLVGWGKELRELADGPSVARHGVPPSEPSQATPLSSRSEGVIEQQSLLAGAFETAVVPDARLEGVSASPGHCPPLYRPPVVRG